MKPKVSVAMCTFNGERFLRQQLESIAGQERPPDELVVCDDGSYDATLEILQEFASRARFPVRLVRNEKNLGSTKNFEKVISLCDGDLIALCDQDDVWEPNKLACLSDVLVSDNSLGGVFSDAELIDADATRMGKRIWELHKFRFARPDDFGRDSAVRLLLKHDVLTGATLMIRACVRESILPIPELWVHDGWIAWMLVLYSRLTFVPEPLLRYRLHENQQLGIGRIGVGQTRERRRANYCREDRSKLRAMCLQFEALRARWISRPGENFAVYRELIDNKITSLRRRSELPRQCLPRAYSILRSFYSYQEYARGLSTMRGDLFLPSISEGQKG